MKTAQETVPVFIEIWKGNWSNPGTGIQVLGEDKTAVDVGLLFGDPRAGTTHDINRNLLNSFLFVQSKVMLIVQ